MGCSCVPAFPISPADPASSWISHPLPIDIGEVSKLCEIEQTNVGGHFECVRETRGKPRLNWTSTNPDPSSTGTLRVTTAAGIEEKAPTSLKKLNLSYPSWEVLSPSVVIRRRPVRMQFLGLP